MHDMASTFGFAKCYLLKPDTFIFYERRMLSGALHLSGTNLVYDPAASVPWANAIVALVWPYAPFAQEVPLCGHYPASNASYHAVNGMIQRLKETEVRAERIYVPVRELLLRSGVGMALHNGLTAIVPYGTRFTIQTLAASLDAPEYDDRKPLGTCQTCGACARACPVGAIDEDGYHYTRCMRAYMGKEKMPESVMEKMTRMLGCELCQNVCPLNAGEQTIPLLPEAFAYERLLTNDLNGALELVGFNQKSGGRLQAHAAVMAANEGRTDLLPLIQALRSDPRELVRAAAEYAISKLHNAETMV